MNTFMLVGKAKEINEKVITLAVRRSYKNINGEYDEDLIPILLWDFYRNNYMHEGDLVAVRGTIHVKDNQIQLFAEKISFLAQKREEE